MEFEGTSTKWIRTVPMGIITRGELVGKCSSICCTVSRWFLKKDAFPGRSQKGADPVEMLKCCQYYVNKFRGFGFEPACLCRRWMCPVLLSRQESREDSTWKRKHTCSRVYKGSHSCHSCRIGPSSKYCWPHYTDNYFGILNRVSESGFGPSENFIRTPLERADFLKILTLNRKVWTPSCRAIWAWSGRINLYNRQIMILLRATDRHAI